MRLIDADELKKECCSVPDPKGRYAELKIIEDYEIDDAPTIFEIPDNATNGDMIKMIFPKTQIRENNSDFITYTLDGLIGTCVEKDWWNSPYK